MKNEILVVGEIENVDVKEFENGNGVVGEDVGFKKINVKKIY